MSLRRNTGSPDYGCASGRDNKLYPHMRRAFARLCYKPALKNPSFGCFVRGLKLTTTPKPIHQALPSPMISFACETDPKGVPSTLPR